MYFSVQHGKSQIQLLHLRLLVIQLQEAADRPVLGKDDGVQMRSILAPAAIRNAGKCTGIMVPISGSGDADGEHLHCFRVDMLQNRGNGLQRHFIFRGAAAKKDRYFFLVHVFFPHSSVISVSSGSG